MRPRLASLKVRDRPNLSRAGYGTLSAVKAITVREPGGPEVLEVAEVPDPAPGPGEVLIEVVATGVNRADLLQRQGRYPPPPGASPILGLECSGRIAAMGADVTGWAVGAECVALLAGGAYAEKVVAPTGSVVRPPAGIDLVTAAGVIEVAATVVSNLDLAGLRTGDRFLVHGGAGGVGSFAIQYANALGATVLTTAGREDKLAYCRSIGADLAVSYREDWVAAVREFTAGDGVDVILDNMGAKYLEPNLAVLAIGGQLMIIGMQGGRVGSLDLGRLMARRASVNATSLRPRPPAEKAAICARVVDTVWPLISSGRVQPAPQEVFPLSDAAAAHQRLESGEAIGKLILTVS